MTTDDVTTCYITFGAFGLQENPASPTFAPRSTAVACEHAPSVHPEVLHY